MNRPTLREFMEYCNPTTIQLLYGEHIVNIDTRCKGSHSLIKAFEDTKYYFKSFENEHLIVDYVG